MGKENLDLNIVCFLWHGDRWSRNDNGVLYVNKLFRAVQKHLSLPHRFICMSSVKGSFDNGIEIIELNAPSWIGCLPKVCMFDPELGLKGQVLSFDIDIVITGSLDEFASYRGNFAVRSSFRYPHLLDGDIVGFKVGFETDRIWKPLKENPKEVELITGGRERFWYRHCLGNEMERFQTLFPGQLKSYKRHVRNVQNLHKDVRIVSCHGRPRPHELNEPWAIENWKNL